MARGQLGAVEHHLRPQLTSNTLGQSVDRLVGSAITSNHLLVEHAELGAVVCERSKSQHGLQSGASEPELTVQSPYDLQSEADEGQEIDGVGSVDRPLGVCGRRTRSVAVIDGAGEERLTGEGLVACSLKEERRESARKDEEVLPDE